MKRHSSTVFQAMSCSQNCNARHPRLCKMETRCKFFRMGICAYKHATPKNDETISNALNKEIDKLKKEVKELMTNIKIKEEQLNKLDTESSKITQ